MTPQASGKRLAAILWFTAAALAFIAVAISVIGEGKPRLTAAAGGLFCLAMGIMTLRSPKNPS